MSDYTKSRISKNDSLHTPPDVYELLNAEFHFNDDPCPFNNQPLFDTRIITDGLSLSWGTSTFMNPPYSNITPWVKKAYYESLKGKTVVGLLRGDTSTRWFHDWVLPYADLRFIKGRLKFNGKPAPFASIIAIWSVKR